MALEQNLLVVFCDAYPSLQNHHTYIIDSRNISITSEIC